MVTEIFSVNCAELNVSQVNFIKEATATYNLVMASSIFNYMLHIYIIYTCMYIYVHVYIHVCIYIYIHVYI